MKAVRKTLALMEGDPQAPGLHTYEYRSLKGAKGEKVFESYVETRTAARVFWCYGPREGYITILAVVAYP